MELSDMKILDIQPSQFYISGVKMEQIEKWFSASDFSDFEPVPVRRLDGRVIFTDGHTRALTAHMQGVERIPLVWDEDEIDEESYRICVNACRRKSIYSIADLKNRILSGSEYEKKWDEWCVVALENRNSISFDRQEIL